MWVEKNNAITKSFVFVDFSEAFSFMTQVAMVAEKMNHHPNWANVWNKVEIMLTTHDAGSTVTEIDRQMAAAIDKIARSYE